MDAALSLKTGRSIAASSADYESQRALLLVCPECGEPVHLSDRTIPRRTRYFSHPELKIERSSTTCSLRILGEYFRPVSLRLTGIKHGQLTDRFQREVVCELLNAFGRHSDSVRQLTRAMIEASSWIILQKEAKEMLNHDQQTSLPIWLDSITSANTEQVDELGEAASDAYMFLLSAYGAWVSVWMLLLAKIAAATISPDQIVGGRAAVGANVGNRRVCFVLERHRVRDISSDQSALALLLTPKRNGLIEPLLVAFVFHTIHRWRFPKLLLLPHLFHISDESITRLAHESVPRPQKAEHSNLLAASKGGSADSEASSRGSINIESLGADSMVAGSDPPRDNPANTSGRGVSWPHFHPMYRLDDPSSNQSPGPRELSVRSWPPPTYGNRFANTSKRSTNPPLLDATASNPSFVNRGANPLENAGDLASFQARLDRRMAEFLSNHTLDSAKFWVHFSDLAVLVNIANKYFIHQSSYRKRNDRFLLSTRAGTAVATFERCYWQ